MAKYVMQQMSDLKGTGDQPLYPRLLKTGTINTDDLTKYISKGTTFSEGEVAGILKRLGDKMADLMGQGYTVKIDGIGIFSASLGLEEEKEAETLDKDESRRNARSIKVDSIRFRADKRLVSETNSQCRLERKGDPVLQSTSPYSAEERLARALQYLDKHPFLRVNDYAALNGLSRTAAQMELKRMDEASDSALKSTGRASHRVYVKK
ncbi:HU family DNA-binding protein [Phocaeicola sp.]